MADLIDMVKFDKWNDGYRYILLVIDTFFKYVWLQPLKYKTGEDVARAFQEIFDISKRSPAKLITDKGQEFKAKKVQAVMKKEEIHYFPTQNETKASTSERAILTIKQKLYRYFTYKEDYAYLPILQSIANSCNHTYHRTIGMSPSDVGDKNQEEVRLATYFSQNRKYTEQDAKLKPFKFRIGDYVRISHLRNPFTRAYDETYTGEILQIHKRYHRGTLPIYRLRDLEEDHIKGTFYESELKKIHVDLNQFWKVEKVLRSKGKGRRKQLFVKWKNYPKKFNSWIKASDIE